jgi:hypothetical protein
MTYYNRNYVDEQQDVANETCKLYKCELIFNDGADIKREKGWGWEFEDRAFITFKK